MANATKTQEPPAEEEQPPVKSRKKTLIIAALVVLVLVGGYLFTSGGAEAADAADAPEEIEPGEVVALDPITLNLADGRFLKVGLALQLVDGVALPPAAEIPGYAAPALDEAISLLGAMTYADLVAPGGRDASKQTLSERIAARYDGDVMSVYFTELVMQ